jgi:alpha/beta superfamily hydrolase
MPEVIFSGPAGRLEGRYHHNPDAPAPIALILHPHPLHGGTMNNRVVYHLYYTFVKLGFSTLRFNFRGVGRSQGSYDAGLGELSDAAAALDWLQATNVDAPECWVAGFSFGAWIGMQLLMRRPEIDGFISVSPPASHYDFSFLAPCPSAGLILHGENDQLVTPEQMSKFVERIKTQPGIIISQTMVKGTNHFFDNAHDKMIEHVRNYVQSHLKGRKPGKRVKKAG